MDEFTITFKQENWAGIPKQVTVRAEVVRQEGTNDMHNYEGDYTVIVRNRNTIISKTRVWDLEEAVMHVAAEAYSQWEGA